MGGWIPCSGHVLIVIVYIGLRDIAVDIAKVHDHLQAGDLPESQDRILQRL